MWEDQEAKPDAPELRHVFLDCPVSVRSGFDDGEELSRPASALLSLILGGWTYDTQPANLRTGTSAKDKSDDQRNQ